MMYVYFKRFCDIVISLIVFLIFIIPMIVVAFLIKLDSKGPVLFKQTRTGYKGKEFKLYKFRSMTANNNVLDFTHENQVTKIGRFIRNTSLDELPQIINVLKGDMSFIGPRPWIVEYYNLFTDEQKKRLDVKPGISGLAQVKGRNNISIIDKINYDLEYVDNCSFKEDLKIIFLTIKIVLKKVGNDIPKYGIKIELDELKKQKNIREEQGQVLV